MRARVVVIGGGVMGVSIAWQLARRFDPHTDPVVLVEKKELAAGSSGRSGAILRQFYGAREVAALARDSLRVFANFERETGRSIGFMPSGVLTLASRKIAGQAELVTTNIAMMRLLGIAVELVDAARIRELVPEARVAVGHGQMSEHQLEQVMLDFWEKRFDVLVCTTIVESGLDVSNANTMIIERADMLGLSQLHQLRGRVGRSRERAYAYFLYPAEKPLTETAHERLATLAQHSDLGGGMAIAMKDLEIRGAGNLLGGEQSGHIADVGFDLYVRLVGEAVSEFRGDKEEELAEVRIELPVDAHLPHDYIPSERLRLEIYKRLAEVRTDEDVDQIREELVDRYGEPPQEVASLLLVARFRARARRAGVGEVTISGKFVRFAPVELPDSRVVRLQRLYPKSVVKAPVRTILVPRPHTGGVGGHPVAGIALLEWARTVLDSVIDPEEHS